MKGYTKIGATREGYGPPGESAGDRIERVAQKAQTRWDTVLVWFMRTVALLWLAKGVFAWALILNAVPGGTSFEADPLGRQAAIVYFAVLDFTAAIGLWLTSAWGGVVWLLAATSAMTLAVLTPQFLTLPSIVFVVTAGIVAIYFVLSWLAAREAQ